MFDILQKEKEDILITKVENLLAKQQDEILLTARETVSVPLGIVRLGNHLFKYASGFGIAKDRNAIFCTEQPSFRFHIFQGPFVKQCKTKPDKTIYEKKFGFCDNRFYKPYKKFRHIALRRYFQCHKYFDKYKKDIKKMFKIKTKYFLKAKTYLENLIGDDNDSILSCFHYRLGDMSRNNEGMNLPKKAFYLKTMAMILNQSSYTKNQFLIISDDPAKAFESLNYLEAFADLKVSHANLETDFIMMANFCDNIVLSRGTFGWWAAFLNTRANVFYQNEFKNNYLASDVNAKTYYIKSWTEIK